jgi:hypothetical protein
MPRGIGICNPRNVGNVLADHRTALEIVQRDHETKWPITPGASICSSKSRRRTSPSTSGTSTYTALARTPKWTGSQAEIGFSSSSSKAANQMS